MLRNTDADWQHLAENDPYFAVITLDRYHVDQIDEDRLEEFYTTGTHDIGTALGHIRARDPGFRPSRALDFGCGVGRLTLAMAEHATEVVGLDVAPAMLARARAATGDRGLSNVRFTDALAPADRFDWINSMIVLQHIPPARGYAILAELLGRLELGGFCSLQVTLFRELTAHATCVGSHWFYDGEGLGLLVKRDCDPIGKMQMYDYDLNRVLALMVGNRIEPYALRMTDHGGNHGAWVFGYRDPARSRIQADRRYTARGSDRFGMFLGSGWSVLEEWGIWTEGQEATLEFLLPTDRKGGAVWLEGRAFVVPTLHPEITIAVEANGTPVDCVRVAAGEPCVSLIVPAGLADQTGALRLRLTIDRPRAPREIGYSGDERALGFGMEAIRLVDA